MDFNYLKEIKKIYENCTSLIEIVFVLGNPTCDIDSALSAYILSIGENIKCGTIKLSKKGKPSLNENPTKIFLPVLNIERGTLFYRIDVKYLFDKFSIDEKDFFYINDEIFNSHKLFNYKNYQDKNIKTNLILVDHTILSDDELYLADYVINIYDHHLLTNYPNLYKNLQKMNIKYPTGSCTTLILNDYFYSQKDEDFPVKIISPLLAVSAILVDTKKFDKDFYDNRWVDLDKKIYKYLKKYIKEEYKDIKMKNYFKEIKDIKHDKEKNLALGIGPLLSKDKKTFNWDKFKAVWSSFPVSLYDIEKKYGKQELINNYMKCFEDKNDEEKKNIFYITNSNAQNKQKIFTIFNPIQLPFNKDEIQNEINKYNKKEEFSADIENITDENGKPCGEICNILLPDTYSRKSFEPILKKFICNLKA